MRKQLAATIICLIVTSAVTAQCATKTPTFAKQSVSHAAANLAGRWRVTFSFSKEPEKHLIFDAKPKGAGSFLLLDTGPNDEAAKDPVPAVWSELSNDRISFSGEAELPIGTCCREIGTVVFKGRFSSDDVISGKLVFVTSVDEEESPYKLRSVIGVFTARRIIR